MGRIRIVSVDPGGINVGDVHMLINAMTVYMRMRKRRHALQKCEQHQ